MAEREPKEVADLVHSASIHVLRRAREQDDALGVSPARLSALSVVVFRGPITIGELAAAEGVRSATMTGIVTGLEEQGLVRRRPDERDRRAVRVEATAAGKRTLTRARRARIDAIAARLAALSGEDLALVWRAAELLEERFGLRPWRPLDADPDPEG
ncbi:MAG: MarR family transcriptional regulator [Actinomycetota bacterium]|nr:MarR family transcriptional regulator [Actinomycetota bacterium]